MRVIVRFSVIPFNPNNITMKRKLTINFGLVSPVLCFIFSGINSINAQPAQFNANVYSGCAPLTVSFYNSSSGSGTYNWNFGDPSSGIYNTSIVCSPTHTFVNPGSYTVTMNYFVGPSTYTATATITVHPKPNPAISGPDTICDGQTAAYTATGTCGSTFFWTINGGTIVGPNTGNTVNVLWPTPGTGLLTVTETTTFGCTNSKTKKVLVANQPRIGNICELRGTSGQPDKHKSSCLCQYNVNTIQALDPNGIILSNSLYNFQWTVTGSGTLVGGQGTNTAQVLVGAGPTVTVQLVVWNDFGCSDTQTCIYDVCKAPHAIFKADTACQGGTTNFNASGSSILADIVSFYWDFGDYSTATTLSPFTTHTYAAPGIYNVYLRVTNKAGCTHDTIIKVRVNSGSPPPINCPGTVCHNTKHCYSTPYYPGAVYNWTVVGHDTFVISTNDTGICVTWGNGPHGNITLQVTGGPYTCGYNSVNIPIFPKKIKISGPDTVCSGSQVTYSVPLIPGSCYGWLPSSPNIQIANNPGNQISVNIPSGFVGTFFLYSDVVNDITCCKGKDTLKVVVQGPIVIDTIQSTCEYSTKTYTSNVPVTWQVLNGTINSSTTTSINITWGSASYGTIKATAINPNLVCENSVIAQIQLVPLPPNPPINGSTLVCVGSVQQYNYINSPLIAGSTWSISPLTPSSPSGNTNTVTFGTVGTYTIAVNYFNNNSNLSGSYKCYSTSQLQVQVVDTTCPIISGPSSSCIGATVTYTLSSNPGGIWSWAIVGGTIVSQTPTSITITWGNISQGQVNIQNTLCNGFCNKKVKINAIPVGTITLGDSTCKGDSIRLYGPPGYTYLWNTGATTQSIKAITTGLYSLTISQLGCSATLNYNLNPIPKKPKPNVSITWNCMAAPSLPIPYQMTATQNPTWSYSWSPQTTTPAAADTTYQHYSTVFNSTHTVIVTNKFGCKDTASVTLTSRCVDTIVCPNPPCPPPCSCKVTFNVNYDPCNGIFSYTQTSGPSITAVLWNFGDGFYSNLSSPQHYYTALGNYSGVLSVWCGCNWVSMPFTINVPYIIRPRIRHTFPISCNYNTISLSYTPTGSTVLGGSLTHQINWGDGPTVTVSGLPQNHTYTSPGTYYVSYTVTALSPYCQKTVYDTVRILPFKANFGFCDSGCVSQPVQFYNNSTSFYPIVQYNWSFGDGNTSNLQSPFHVYATTGVKTVKLVITNQQGCKDSITYNINITIFNAGALTYTVNGTPAAGPNFTICEGSYVTATAPLVSGWTYAWNSGTFQNIDTIRKTGIYYCVVANGKGCTDTLGPFKVIVNPNPNATILMADSSCHVGYLYLQALSGLGYSYSWNVNNGAYTATGNPAYVFPPPGVYSTVLTVTNAFGCTAMDTMVVTSLAPPSVSVSPNFTTICQGNTVTLTATVAGPYSSLTWYNGDTSSSIVVYNQGNHTVTVTDAFGCVATAGGYVVVNPLPDLSNIPKGCYKICNNQGGVKVCGPIPIASLGQVFTYNWLRNGVPWSTNQNVTITTNGSYQLIVVNTNTGCTDTSEVFNIQFVPGPSVSIGSPTPNPVICKGQVYCITIHVNNPQNDVIYTWFEDDEQHPIDVADSIIVCRPGIYIVRAYKSDCCKSYDTLIIKEGDCCFDVQNPNFHLIQDSTVYTTNQWWDGKYYVAGRVYVRNKAVLDMTTIDVVFDRDGEIIFEDSSIVRANNSVFRPCEMHDVWVGFTFKDSSSGFIHTSTFKNAKHAIDINTSGPEGVKITDNTFTDCNIGVRIDRGSRPYNQGVTHNSFVVSDYNFTQPGLYSSYDYFGVILRSVRMQEIVSQNIFRNSDRSAQNNRFNGIYMLRSEAILSENKFSNMYRSIDVISNIGLVTAENNEVEKTFQGKFPSDVQIRVTNCDLPVLVYANELRNSDNRYANTVGIFAERTTGINIRDNNVKGFDVGIWTRRTQKSVVNENDIDLSGDVGILDSLSSNMDINCNVVRMKDCKKVFLTNCQSVGIYMQQGDASNSIYTNCVFDTRRAIIVQRFGAPFAIPNIINNYMYNYQFAGIASYNHFGAIGGGAQSGRNTFVSNNFAGGAWDIAAFGGLVTQQCNFGTMSTFGVTSTGCPGNAMTSSTAACGHQINNLKTNKLDKWDVCDNYTGKGIIIIDHGGGIEVDKGKLGVILLGQVPKEEKIQVLQKLIFDGDKSNYELWLGRLKEAKALSAFEFAFYEAQWTYSNVNRSAGIMALTSVITSNTDEADRKDVLLSIWKSENANMDPAALSQMKLIDQNNGDISPLARDLVHSYAGNHDYKFGKYYLEKEPALRNPDNKFIRLKPNPATTEVIVEFSIEGSENARVDLIDLAGQRIDRKAMVISESAYQFNLKGIAPGVYLVSVLDIELNVRHVAKLVVQ